MSSYKTDKRQIAKNSGLLYLRSLFNLFLSLYTSRLVLAALGVDDYGIYNAVGGFVSMFWMLTGALNSAVTRFLAYEMGHEDNGRVKDVFALALTILLALGVIVVLLAETFGLWFLKTQMTIPAGRETAAFWVFQTVVVFSVIGLVSAPFNSSVVAHEKFGVYAFLSIGETILLFILALFLTYCNRAIDLLIVYAVGRSVISLVTQTITVVYSRLHFEESRFRLKGDKALSRQLLGFTGWSLLGSVTNMFSGQGVNVALNVFCGPAVNAARGLAFTVTNSVGIFVNNFTSAIVPQITKSYAAEDRQYFRSLVFKGSKLAFFVMLLFVVPLSVEADFVLSLWLKDVPEYTLVFTRFALLTALIAMYDNLFSQAQKASGIIRKYQIVISIITAANFVLSYLALRTGYPPISVYVVGLVVAVACVCATTVISSRTLNFRIGDIVKQVYLPETAVMLLSCIIPVFIHVSLPFGWIRFILVLILSLIFTSALAYLIGCNREERSIIGGFVKNNLIKVRGK